MYDFKTLSPHDFELLSRDLLQKKLNIILESFKGGKDGGIDLRHAPSKDKTLVVQCKHYAETGYRGLLAVLKNERSKVKRLAPLRYIITTSVSLLVSQKNEIFELLKPYCLNEEDILGIEELNNLLNLYPEIEKQHFKLWLTSTTVLEQIINSDIVNQTKIMLEEIHQRTRVYVQNKSFFEALGILKAHNYCIISGNPGIGKTFLADILLLEHVRQGYEPIVIRRHISEGFRLLNSTRRQVFYYDDFLGQTGWEDKLEKNEDQSILDFTSYIQSHSHAVFILTTREYILQQAMNVYEKFHSSNIDIAKCIIQVESYTRRNKASILYNHLFFSNIPMECKEVLVSSTFLLKIIDHENYSPRIVDWMTSFNNIQDYATTEYPKAFLATLDEPTELWQHAYHKHLSPASRSMLIVLFSFQSAVDIRDLSEAFNHYRTQEAMTFGISRQFDEFDSSLNELEGSFVRIEPDKYTTTIGFQNPSVRDFLEKYISINSELVRVLCESLVFYDQFRGVFSPQATHYHEIQLMLGKGNSDELIKNAVIRTLLKTAKRRMIKVNSDGVATTYNLVDTTLERNVIHALNMTTSLPTSVRAAIIEFVLMQEEKRIATRICDLGDIPAILKATKMIDYESPIKDQIIKAAQIRFEEIHDYYELDQIGALSELYKVAPNVVNEGLFQRVSETLATDYDIIFDDEITSATDEHVLDELLKVVKDFEAVYDVSLDKIRDSIENQRDEILLHMEPPDDWDEPPEEKIIDATDNEIVSMFASMFE